MKIYTKGGDRGETSLIGGGRVSKSDPRIDAYGTVDELNSMIGVARASWDGAPLDGELQKIQSDLFDVGAHLAATASREKFPGPDEERIAALEESIDRMEAELEPLKNFILPGGSLTAAYLHLARTVCRRAERLVVALGEEAAVSPSTLVYLNRLSDLLFVAARYANRLAGVRDVLWG
ncbi:MAG: cob(I)yrinic acid a,c-diamide adenosyltransferase [Thermoanaerobaculia bacterium]